MIKITISCPYFTDSAEFKAKEIGKQIKYMKAKRAAFMNHPYFLPDGKIARLTCNIEKL